MKTLMNVLYQFSVGILIADFGLMLIGLNMMFWLVWIESALLILSAPLLAWVGTLLEFLAIEGIAVIVFWLCLRFYRFGTLKRANRWCLDRFKRLVAFNPSVAREAVRAGDI